MGDSKNTPIKNGRPNIGGLCLKVKERVDEKKLKAKKNSSLSNN